MIIMCHRFDDDALSALAIAYPMVPDAPVRRHTFVSASDDDVMIYSLPHLLLPFLFGVGAAGTVLGVAMVSCFRPVFRNYYGTSERHNGNKMGLNYFCVHAKNTCRMFLNSDCCDSIIRNPKIIPHKEF